MILASLAMSQKEDGVLTSSAVACGAEVDHVAIGFNSHSLQINQSC